MRNYEIALVVDPELDEKALAELETRVIDKIQAAGGTPGKIDRWGRRRLAYPIRKRRDGNYLFLQAQMPEAAGAELDRELRLQESVLRYMLTLEPAAA